MLPLSGIEEQQRRLANERLAAISTNAHARIGNSPT